MNVKMLLGLVLGVVAWCLTGATASQAQSGCPVQLPAAHDYAVVAAKLLVPANLEQASSATPNTFVEMEITFDFDGQGRVFLSSSAEALSPTCVDDYLEISGPLGVKVFDYRSADRSRIEFRDPLATELTPLLTPGANVLRIRLVDVGQYYGNSQLYLATVTELPPLPTPTLEKTAATATATIVPTSTPTATATSVGQALVNLLPSATPTQTVVVAHNEPPQPDPIPVWSWSRLLIGLILLMLTSGVLWSVWRQWAGPGVVPGGADIFYRGNQIQSVVFSDNGKRSVWIGGQGADIVLADEFIPARVARISGQRGQRGHPQAVIEIFDPDHPGEVTEQHLLENGDVFYFGDFKLVYKRFEAEPSLFERSVVNV